MKVELIPCNNGLGARLSIRDFAPKAWKAQFAEIESLEGFISQAGIAKEFLDKASLAMAYELLSNAPDGNTSEALEEAQSIMCRREALARLPVSGPSASVQCRKRKLRQSNGRALVFVATAADAR